jgi:hypothetical protein
MDGFVSINSGAQNAGLHVESTDSSANLSLADNSGSVVLSGSSGALIVETGGTASSAGSAATERMRVTTGGLVCINDTANAGMTQGLTLNQGANDNEIFACKSSDVAHGLTDQAETDTYFSIQKAASATGGVIMKAIGDGSARTNFRMFCYSQGPPDTANSTSGFGEFRMDAYRHDGSNSTSAHGSDANLLTVHNAGNAKFIVKGDGDIYYDGADQGAYDSYNDAHLIRTMDTAMSPKAIIQNKFDDYIKYNEKTLVDAGLLGDVPDKSKGETPLVNVTGMQRLHNGAIWQQYTEMQKMKELMYDTMVELIGKEKADAKLKDHDIKLLDKNTLLN